MRNAIVMKWVIVSGMVTRLVPINVRIIDQKVAWLLGVYTLCIISRHYWKLYLCIKDSSDDWAFRHVTDYLQQDDITKMVHPANNYGKKPLSMISIRNMRHSEASCCARSGSNSFILISSTPCELEALFAVTNQHFEIWPCTLVLKSDCDQLFLKYSRNVITLGLINNDFLDCWYQRVGHDEIMSILMLLTDCLALCSPELPTNILSSQDFGQSGGGWLILSARRTPGDIIYINIHRTRLNDI